MGVCDAHSINIVIWVVPVTKRDRTNLSHPIKRHPIRAIVRDPGPAKPFFKFTTRRFAQATRWDGGTTFPWSSLTFFSKSGFLSGLPVPSYGRGRLFEKNWWKWMLSSFWNTWKWVWSSFGDFSGGRVAGWVRKITDHWASAPVLETKMPPQHILHKKGEEMT